VPRKVPALAKQVFESHLGQLKAITEMRGQRGLRDLYERAKDDLETRLRRAGRGKTTATAVELRALLAQVDAVLGELGEDLEDHLSDVGGMAARLGARHGVDEWKQLSTKFQGTTPVVGLDRAAVFDGLVDGTTSSLLRRYKRASKTWSHQAIGSIENELAVGAMANVPMDQLIDRVMKAGGVMDTERWKAERIVRTECLLGSTPVEGMMVRAVFRRWYEGHVVKVVTESGRHLSATPNHPVLTRRGWIGAGELQEGDEVVCDARKKDMRPSVDEDVAARPTPIAQVFDALSAVGVRERRRGAQPDFHGDGFEGEVDVASTDRPLSFGDFAPLRQPSGELVLAPPDPARARFGLRFGDPFLVADGRGGLRAPHDVPGFANALVDKVRAHAQRVGDALCALATQVSLDDLLARNVVAATGLVALHEMRSRHDVDARLLQPARHRLVGRPEPLCDLDHALAGPVELDRVRHVEIQVFEGHVFNLSTRHGYYVAGGMYTANCAYAHGATKFAAIKKMRDEDGQDNLRKKVLENYDDDRVGDDSILIHGQVVDVDAPFTWKTKRGKAWVLKEFMFPPNRPNDRGVVIPWDPDWDDDADEHEEARTIEELESAPPTRWRKEVGVEIPPGHKPGESYEGGKAPKRKKKAREEAPIERDEDLEAGEAEDVTDEDIVEERPARRRKDRMGFEVDEDQPPPDAGDEPPLELDEDGNVEEPEHTEDPDELVSFPGELRGRTGEPIPSPPPDYKPLLEDVERALERADEEEDEEDEPPKKPPPPVRGKPKRRR